MSVIAKLSIRSIAQFGTGQLAELGCVCENDLMAAYATSEEDKLFTKYSPWGEMKVCQPSGYSLGQESDEFAPGAAFYAMVLSKDEGPEVPAFPGSYAYCSAVLSNVMDFGDGQARRFEFRNGGPANFHHGVDRLNWKMSVDNPAVFDQWKGGMSCWIILYPAAQYDRDGAIRAAHGRPVPEQA